MDVWWPEAIRRPVSYAGSAGAFKTQPLGWILHTVVGNGSPWGLFERAPASNQRFSHLWVAKDGTVEQYAPLTGKSWAQVEGNASYWSVETEGYTGEALTPAQLASLAKWHVYSGAPDVLASKPGDRGIGTHYMGGAAWGGHTCPDLIPGRGPRSKQRAQILAVAQSLRTGGADMPLTQDDLNAIIGAVWGAEWTEQDANGKQIRVNAGTRLARAAAAPTAVDIAHAVLALLPSASTGGLTADQIRQAAHDGVVSALRTVQ